MLKTLIKYFINLFIQFCLAFSDYLCFYRVHNNENNNNTIYKIFIICLNNFCFHPNQTFINSSYVLLNVFTDNLSL